MPQLSTIFILFSLVLMAIGAPVTTTHEVISLTKPSQGDTFPSFATDSESVFSETSEEEQVTIAARGVKFLPGAIPSVDKTMFRKRGGFFPGFFGGGGSGDNGDNGPFKLFPGGGGGGCHGPCFLEEPGKGNAPAAVSPPAGASASPNSKSNQASTAKASPNVVAQAAAPPEAQAAAPPQPQAAAPPHAQAAVPPQALGGGKNH